MNKQLLKKYRQKSTISSNKETKERIPFSQLVILLFWFCYLITNENKSSQQVSFLTFSTFASISFYLIIMFYGYRMLAFFDKRNFKSYIKRVTPYFLCLLLANFIILVKDIGFSISLGFAKDYVKKVFEQPNREYMAYGYVLITFILFVPFLKEMLNNLSNTEKKWLFYVILGYFAFMTSEFFFQYLIHIANFPFVNMWGYILTGWLLKNIQWNKKEQLGLLLFGLMSCFFIIVISLYYPNAQNIPDLCYIFRLGSCLFVFYLLGFATKPEKEFSLFPLVLLIPFFMEVIM